MWRGLLTAESAELNTSVQKASCSVQGEEWCEVVLPLFTFSLLKCLFYTSLQLAVTSGVP